MNLNYESHMYGSIKIQVDDSLLASVKFATKGTLKSAFSYLKIPLQNWRINTVDQQQYISLH